MKKRIISIFICSIVTIYLSVLPRLQASGESSVSDWAAEYDLDPKKNKKHRIISIFRNDKVLIVNGEKYDIFEGPNFTLEQTMSFPTFQAQLVKGGLIKYSERKQNNRDGSDGDSTTWAKVYNLSGGTLTHTPDSLVYQGTKCSLSKGHFYPLFIRMSQADFDKKIADYKEKGYGIKYPSHLLRRGGVCFEGEGRIKKDCLYDAKKMTGG